MIAERADLVAMVTAVTYAFENLLPHSGDSSGSGPTLERLLRYFTQYISWALDAFRSNDEFKKLVASNSDFAEALVESCSPALTPPWVMDIITGASGSRAAGKGSEKLTLTTSTDSNHILYRNCTCGYTGVMGVLCASCGMFDDQVGMGVEFHGSHLGTVGVDRISGTKTNLQYTCNWCQELNNYDTVATYFYENHNGRNSSYHSQLCLGYLWCPKCHKRGYLNTIS